MAPIKKKFGIRNKVSITIIQTKKKKNGNIIL